MLCRRRDRRRMLRAARTAARIASSGKAGKPVGLTEKTIAKSRYAVTEPWEDVSLKAKIPYLEKLNERFFSGQPGAQGPGVSCRQYFSCLIL